MASDRIRSKSTIGTRLSSLETAAENAAKSDNVGELSVLDSRVSKLESLSKDLSSFNWRLEQEYPSMDERYVLAGEGGGSSTQITDWNLATEPGNYWSYQGGTINGPVSAWLVGVVEDFGTGSSQVRVQSVYIANASEGQSGYGTVWRRYYNVSTGTFTTTWAPLMPPAHTHTKAQITDFAHTHDWSDVKAYPDTGNLFRNGYFRWGLTDWSVPADITASMVTVPDGPNGQSTSVLRATPLDSDGGIVNVLPSGTAEGQVIPGMTYDFVLVARVVSGSTGNCRIRIGLQSAGLSNQWPVVDGTNLAGSTTNGVWQTLSGSYTVSPTEPRERMSAAIHFSGNNGSTTYEIASVTMIPRGIRVPSLDSNGLMPYSMIQREDTGWVDIPLASGFSSVNSVEKPQVRKLNGIVFLRGGIKIDGLSTTAAATMGTVPVGFRPDASVYGQLQHSTVGSTTPATIDGRVRIGSNGVMSAFLNYRALVIPSALNLYLTSPPWIAA